MANPLIVWFFRSIFAETGADVDRALEEREAGHGDVG